MKKIYDFDVEKTITFHGTVRVVASNYSEARELAKIQPISNIDVYSEDVMLVDLDLVDERLGSVAEQARVLRNMDAPPMPKKKEVQS